MSLDFTKLENTLADMIESINKGDSKKIMNSEEFALYAKEQTEKAKSEYDNPDTKDIGVERIKALNEIVKVAINHDFSNGGLEVDVFVGKSDSKPDNPVSNLKKSVDDLLSIVQEDQKDTEDKEDIVGKVDEDYGDDIDWTLNID